MTLLWIHEGNTAHSIRTYSWEGTLTHCGRTLPLRVGKPEKLETWSRACGKCFDAREGTR